ncbi:acyl-CoA dehydrogenase family protein [Actinomadura xylanilytica]|uniref:acyl-CoA dehydrogenase family protein n=1 Tax=Actinomadura xylanilytica TaxID=887459 RepID=UPI00255B2003|nr:acyl-CoA dehydrogenase family protein [Actinomadura xylanilytica]MDL4777408.1 acyl-CoA dehydrogenase family protein [Actinomadura xylanilytica]
MRFALTTEQRDFGAAVAALLEAVPEGDGRWARLAELGVPAVLVPEEHGGAGGDDVDLLAPLEEAGRAAAPEPIVEAAVAAGLLRGTDLAAEWLPRLAAGEAFIAVTEPGTPHAVHAARAGLLLTERDGAWFATSAFALAERPSIDPARGLSSVDAPDGVRLAEGPEAADRGAALTAAYLLGVGRQMIDMTVRYAGQRVQFGRAIGSYQAVKHQLADALVAVEFARPTVHRAAHSLAAAAPTASRDASAAKAMASDAALHAARVALQVHGAIGYTMEHDLHRWLRRAWSLAAAWGDADHHRRRVADLLLGAEGEPVRTP